MAVWTHSGAVVFTGSTPTSWTSLDLTADIGASPTGFTTRGLALLKVEANNGNPYVGFRPFDQNDDWYHAAVDGHGVCSARVDSAKTIAALIMVPTSEIAKISWMASAVVADFVITLLGWIEPVYDFSEILELKALPVAWTNIDRIPYITGADESFSYFVFRQLAGTANKIGTRQDQESDDFLDASAGAIGGASQGDTGAVNKTIALVNIPDPNAGKIEIKANAVVPECSIDLMMHEIDGWYPDGSVIFSMNNPPASWTDLDLSTEMHSMQGLAVIKIERDSSLSGTMIGFGFRSKGDTGIYLDSAIAEPAGASTCSIDASKATIILVETSTSSTIQWNSTNAGCQCELTLLGFLSENTPPTYSGQSPTGSGNAPGDNIVVYIADDDSTTQNTIQMVWTDPDGVDHNVILAGAFQATYSGTISANGSNGYDITVSTHPDLSVGTWTVTVTATDGMGKSSTDSWSFDVDASTPVVSDQTPSGIITEQFDRIYCKVEDPWGIDTSTIGFVARSTSRRELIGIVAGAFQTGWVGSISTEASGTIAHIQIDEWPELEDIRNWTFEITGQSDVGKDF